MNEVKYIPLRVRRRYFNPIVKGKKRVEYRRKSEYWRKRLYLKRQQGEKERIAVFICGKDVHRRWIEEVHETVTPDNFSPQGKLDVDTPTCFALYLGPEARRPRHCPICGSDDIGQLNSIDSSSNQEYERLGGRWYCVTCGWTERDNRN